MRLMSRQKFLVPLAVLFLLGVAPARGEESAAAVGNDEAAAVEDAGSEAEAVEPVTLSPYETEVEPHRFLDASAGYRFVETDGYGGRAAEYEYLRPSVTGGVHGTYLGKDLKLDIDGAYLNSNDYHATLDFDYAGYYRFDFRTESLFHNLDHETYPLPPSLAIDAAPLDRYGITTRQDASHFRYKLRDYPIHLNLSHWLIDREGTAQLRFADFSFENMPASTLHSRSRSIDRTTQEGTAGFDAHLGPINLLYQFRIRQHDERGGTPADSFVAQKPGPAEHNENPDSRFYSHTVKLYSSLAGGITGAASYSYARSENRSSLSTVIGADQARDTLQNAAGDFTYAPCAWFATAVRYRHQEVEHDRPSILVVPSFTGGVTSGRPLFDTVRDIISANIKIRPNTILSVNGEYRGSFLRRDGVAAGEWSLPEDSATHSGTLTLLLRPFKGLRLRALYGYSTTDNPSYGTSPEQKHEGQFLASYTRNGRWGASVNYRISREWNDSIARSTHPFDGSPSTTYVLPRDRVMANAAAGLWVSPTERLVLSGQAGLLRNRSDQTVLFASVLNGYQAASDYVSQGELYSLNATYHATDSVDLSLALQELHSRAEFKPAATTDGGFSTVGVRELSRVKTIERSLSARVDYRVTRHFACALDYSFRDYDNRDGTFGEGTVHVVSASVKTIW